MCLRTGFTLGWWKQSIMVKGNCWTAWVSSEEQLVEAIETAKGEEKDCTNTTPAYVSIVKRFINLSNLFSFCICGTEMLFQWMSLSSPERVTRLCLRTLTFSLLIMA